ILKTISPVKNKLESKQECSICQTAIKDKDCKNPVEISCGHQFCCECLTRWFKEQNTCPVCRKVPYDLQSFKNCILICFLIEMEYKKMLFWIAMAMVNYQRILDA